MELFVSEVELRRLEREGLELMVLEMDRRMEEGVTDAVGVSESKRIIAKVVGV